MQRRFGNRKAITVYLDETEYAQVVKKAGSGKVSAWARERLLDGVGGKTGADVRRVEKSVPAGPSTSTVGRVGVDDDSRSVLPEHRKRTEKTCVHGKGKGFNCWQCGGLAKVTE